MKNNAVTKPSHYTDGKIEVIDFIVDKKLGFSLGNAVKYISRAGKKVHDKLLEDLFKAAWYVNHYILEVAAVTAYETHDLKYVNEALKGFDNEIEALNDFKSKLDVIVNAGSPDNNIVDEPYSLFGNAKGGAM